MPPLSRVFLDQRDPLAHQVAGFLLSGLPGRPWDLSDTQVWVPTAGAGRRIRFALARMASEMGSGVLSPEFIQPMQAMLPQNGTRAMASRSEREAAWARVIERVSPDSVSALFPRSESIADQRALLGAGGMLCDLCDLLAEGGYDPANPGLVQVCVEDAERWEQIRLLYQSYLKVLAECGLQDPNVLRLEEITNPHPKPGLQRVVIACIPDLSQAVTRFAEALGRMGVEVFVLIWKPGAIGGGFDGWGRPLSEEWAGCEVPVESGHIAMAKDPEDEAAQSLRYLADAGVPGDYSLVLADSALSAAFGSEILRLGGRPFLPEGGRLSATEAGIIAIEWLEWLAGGQLRTIRRLLECPRFARWIGDRSNLAPSQLLSACDFLISEVLAETLGQAEAFFQDLPDAGDASPLCSQAGKLVQALVGASKVSSDKILREAWTRGGEGLEAARQVAGLWDGISDSIIFSGWPEGREAAFVRALKEAGTFSVSMPGDVELAGWLEAPWLDAARVAVCGCVEGRLPASVTEHAFLPDSKRKNLGLLDNAARLARDAYLLTCLLNVRSVDNFRCSFSKFGPDGSPSLPSNLLLRCAERELPARVLETFKIMEGGRVRPRRENSWLWRLPPDKRKSGLTRISPTGIKDYLACPFRFYFKRVLSLQEFDPRAREMDALRFGSLIHKAVEDFAKNASGEKNAGKIERIVFDYLDREVLHLFGSQPSPAVRVQIEAVKVRLRAFARVQACSFSEGWRIIEAEKKIDAKAPDPVRLGPLSLSAQIDRIEEHPEFGLRIVDYKSYANPKKPEQSHLGGAMANGFLPEARVAIGGKEKCWVDLQLPIYRLIAEKLYPGRPVRTAYFILPADPSQTGIEEFELPDDLYASAITCAEAVADLVHRGVFWPPQPFPGNWDDPFASLFLNGTAENSIDGETITFLKGQP